MDILIKNILLMSQGFKVDWTAEASGHLLDTTGTVGKHVFCLLGVPFIMEYLATTRFAWEEFFCFKKFKNGHGT